MIQDSRITSNNHKYRNLNATNCQFSVSFVIPCKRDKRVNDCVDAIFTYAKANAISAEVIVCGDALDGLLPKRAKFISVIPAHKGICIQQGIYHSKGKIIIACDADFPVLPCDITSVLKAMENADIVIGNRYDPNSKFIIMPPFYRRCLSRIFRLLKRTLLNLSDFDTQCGFKAYARPVALLLYENKVQKNLAYDVQILLRALKAGLRVVQVPVHWKSSENSTINLWTSSFPALLGLLRLSIAQKFRDEIF